MRWTDIVGQKCKMATISDQKTLLVLTTSFDSSLILNRACSVLSSLVSLLPLFLCLYCVILCYCATDILCRWYTVLRGLLQRGFFLPEIKQYCFTVPLFGSLWKKYTFQWYTMSAWYTVLQHNAVYCTEEGSLLPLSSSPLLSWELLNMLFSPSY